MRSTAETLELDLSLRQSRTVYVTLAVIFFPIALTGIVLSFSAIAATIESLSNEYFPVGLVSAVFTLVIGIVFVAVEYIVISQIIEANRRLRILRDKPDQTVRKLPAPFLSSLFGPYH